MDWQFCRNGLGWLCGKLEGLPGMGIVGLGLGLAWLRPKAAGASTGTVSNRTLVSH